MDKLIKAVTGLIKDEYFRASEKHGLYHYADHHSVAVLAEEVEESRDEIANVMEDTQDFWNLIKMDASDEEKLSVLSRIRRHGMLAACECIQVAAMAYKAEETIKHRGEQQ